jgi:hypothetical protein
VEVENTVGTNMWLALIANGVVLILLAVGLFFLVRKGWSYPKLRSVIVILGVILIGLVMTATYFYILLGQTDWSK